MWPLFVPQFPTLPLACFVLTPSVCNVHRARVREYNKSQRVKKHLHNDRIMAANTAYHSHMVRGCYSHWWIGWAFDDMDYVLALRSIQHMYCTVCSARIWCDAYDTKCTAIRIQRIYVRTTTSHSFIYSLSFPKSWFHTRNRSYVEYVVKRLRLFIQKQFNGISIRYAFNKKKKSVFFHSSNRRLGFPFRCW